MKQNRSFHLESVQVWMEILKIKEIIVLMFM